MLADMKVIGQVDCKFIVCEMRHEGAPPYLVVFDQHAVHERIRVEQLRKNLYVDERLYKGPIKSVQLTEPTDLIISDGDARLATQMERQLRSWGLRGHVERVVDDCTVIYRVEHVPEALLPWDGRQQPIFSAQPAADTVSQLLHDLIDTARDTAGASRVPIPKTILDIINLRACRYAIKFGDELSLVQCCDLLHALCECQLPFQCAHGRPSLAPLLDISSISSYGKGKGALVF
jgi:DNA mismatch repair protein MLH3